MPLLVDHSARDIAIRRSVLPECLHVPIAAKDVTAISHYIGTIEKSLGKGSPAKAFLVKTGLAPEIDSRLPIWELPRSAIFHQETQVWVHAEYNGYRAAYRKAFPDEDIAGQVLSHCMNRRHALLKGFQYIRIIPTSRAINSSSAFSENWGIGISSKPRELQSFNMRGVFIHYADLVDLMVMLDLKIGGGIMELVKDAQKLVMPR